ncbi:FtsX-like permease family protein [Salisediminibacterium beveridgei]|uniref:Putative hemin transport system permease protein HrtB n=1 Tax=Salisediminibacterium beveridgei TaxID=632773 RepID=A0A1D7QZJ9_9BACI|nr:ABC transporter permease [Salisediminibacterium beveridgei]AOM84428.1 Heme efflux system permease HrtB [Salisediminibacterium beveridgei]
MRIAFKEIRKSKMKFTILGSIIFLISFLTFMIAGLANGLSYDNASLIKDMPEGVFYLDEAADENVNMSEIDPDTQENVFRVFDEAMVMSIQNGALHDAEDVRHNVVFVAAFDTGLFGEVESGEIFVDQSMREEINTGDTLTAGSLRGDLTVKGFLDHQKYNHAPVALISPDDYQDMFQTEKMQLVFIPGGEGTVISGLDAFSNDAFLNTIPSYSAEQLSLNMIVWFLVGISGMLFAIFFYMMNVQKIGLYGILKAIGVKTSSLFLMMWVQMLTITIGALLLSGGLSQLFQVAVTELPFELTLEVTLQLSLIFLVIGFLGATVSGIQIKKIEPLQAIQQGEM